MTRNSKNRLMLKFRKITKKPTELKKLENKLWEIFSVYIRLRDSDNQGMGFCFTCKKPIHWSKGDCGHGIGRQHKATKFNEQNNHLQCKHCNGFEEGRKDLYKPEMDKRYGSGTWDRMQVAAMQTAHYSVPVLKNNIEYYYEKVKELKEKKGIS